MPNIALMRLSAYHRAMGDEVILNARPLDQPDLVYISTMFTWRRPKVEALASQFCGSDVRIGGSGWDLALRLPPEVDDFANDYSLYGIDYGMGYSSRGCIRKCAFCPVPRMEGAIHEADPIEHLLNPASSKVMLLDNNFFASDWKPKLATIRDRGLLVDWPQGNDIRLMTDAIAHELADLHSRRQIWSDSFTKRGVLHFAWDLPANDARESEVTAGIDLLFGAGFGPRNLRFLLLVGYPGYDLAEEVHRVETLHSLGIEPYVMVYRDYGEADNRSRERKDLAHWNNGHAWRRVPFPEYRRELCS